MQLGIDYTPSGLLARYCIQCPDETGTPASYAFLGESHRVGKRISPAFPDFLGLALWLQAQGWEYVKGGDGFDIRKI